MPTSRTTHVLALALVCAALLAGGFLWYAARGHHADVVTGSSTPDGWQTISYRGVRVDIPASWHPAETDDCEFQFEQWVPPDSPDCQFDQGVAFYLSATFDPAHGPGIRRTDSTGRPASLMWAGYTTSRDLAVYASDEDRAVVEKVLGSVR